MVETQSSRLEQMKDWIWRLKDKIDSKEKKKSSQTKDLRPTKGLCRNSAIPLKHQTYKS
jgi:hypothetical protein